ncbi:MAG: hypothetical protein JJ992_11940 [Planctomycetes bacterium]|nr:hypothetical protein [Planctomycetota bacterium]
MSAPQLSYTDVGDAGGEHLRALASLSDLGITEMKTTEAATSVRRCLVRCSERSVEIGVAERRT